MELVLGIDLGTTNFKAALFDSEGRQRGLGRVAVQPDTDGRRCELPTDRFWQILGRAVGQAVAQAHALRGDIQAMAYSSQANSVVLLDDQARPLTPLLLWPDVRDPEVDPAVDALWSRPEFLRVTGLGVGPSPAFGVAKLRWLQRHRPEVWSAACHMMTISDYLTHGLSGQAVGDAGTAALLGILDLSELQWWPPSLAMLDIDRRQLGLPLRPGSVAGAVTESGARRLGVPAGIPMAVGGLDHYMAALGAGLGTLGEMSVSLGTVLACVRHATSLEPLPGCACGPGLEIGLHYRLGFDENGASVLAWYQREHAPDLAIPELLDLAQRVGAGDDCPIALPDVSRYEGLSGFQRTRPSHSHGHYVRAILDAGARNLGRLVDSVGHGSRPKRLVATGGGARSDFWLRLCARRLGADLVRGRCEEPASLGAAMVAAVAAGWFREVPPCAAAWVQAEKVFSPSDLGP